MGDIIYWKKFDEPKIVFDPVSKKDKEITGEWICGDDRVDAFTVYGCMSGTGTQMHLGADIKTKVMPNGKIYRRTFRITTVKENSLEEIVSMSERWLQDFDYTKEDAIDAEVKQIIDDSLKQKEV